jgi:hypothetical protein
MALVIIINDNDHNRIVLELTPRKPSFPPILMMIEATFKMFFSIQFFKLHANQQSYVYQKKPS